MFIPSCSFPFWLSPFSFPFLDFVSSFAGGTGRLDDLRWPQHRGIVVPLIPTKIMNNVWFPDLSWVNLCLPEAVVTRLHILPYTTEACYTTESCQNLFQQLAQLLWTDLSYWICEKLLQNIIWYGKIMSYTTVKKNSKKTLNFLPKNTRRKSRP
jgi:hypothetical protein